MKIYCIEKHLRGIIIYIFPLLIGVTELRPVHVHQPKQQRENGSV